MLDPSLLTAAQMEVLVAEAYRYARITRYSHVAAYSLFVYDWLLCLREEINFLKQGGSWRGRSAYAFCRFWPLVTYPITLWVQMNDHTPAKCLTLFSVPMFTTILNLVGAAGILILRIYAFTGGQKWVAAFLGSCVATVAAFQAYVSGAQSSLIPIPIGCYPVDKGPHKFLSGYFLSALLLDTLITTTFIVVTLTRTHTKYSSMTDFTKMFIREGAAYFIAISIVNIINGYFNYQPLQAMATVAVPFSLLLPNLLACRLVINLRSSKNAGDPDSFHPLSVNHSSSAHHSQSHSHSHSATFEVALEDMSQSNSHYSTVPHSASAGNLEFGDRKERRPSTIKWGTAHLHSGHAVSRAPSPLSAYSGSSAGSGAGGDGRRDRNLHRDEEHLTVEVFDGRRAATPEKLRALGAPIV